MEVLESEKRLPFTIYRLLWGHSFKIKTLSRARQMNFNNNLLLAAPQSRNFLPSSQHFDNRIPVGADETKQDVKLCYSVINYS